MNIDAAELGITHGLFGDARASTVVSGLPLVAMPVEQAIAIVHGAFAMHLGPGGAFYQFTYLPRCPIPVRRLAAIGIRAERIGIAWANMPPAAVYRLQRCADFRVPRRRSAVHGRARDRLRRLHDDSCMRSGRRTAARACGSGSRPLRRPARGTARHAAHERHGRTAYVRHRARAAASRAAHAHRQSIGHFRLHPFGSPMSPFLRRSDFLPL